MSTDDRLRDLLGVMEVMQQLEELTGINRETWSAVKNSTVAVNRDYLSAVCAAFPEYKMWLKSGKTAPGLGQISPLY